MPPPYVISSIAVIVVNYGTADLALEAVESVLARHHGGRRVEVHLVDNASPNDDAARFAAAHDEQGWGSRVTLHLETVNHGFGRGNNVVLERLSAGTAPPDAVFFLNPDARLRTETIDTLADFLESHPDTALAGCGISRPDGTVVTSAFRFPSVRSEFVAGASFGPVARLFGSHAVALPPDLPSRQVDWVSGAAFMARFEAIRDVGLFDPDFFLYFEEIDLMKRISEAGWKIWHVAGIDIVHEAGAATGLAQSRTKSGRLPGYWYESWRMYFVKRYGRGGALGIALVRLLGWLIDLLTSSLRGRRPAAPRFFIRDFGNLVVVPLLRGRHE